MIVRKEMVSEMSDRLQASLERYVESAPDTVLVIVYEKDTKDGTVITWDPMVPECPLWSKGLKGKSKMDYLDLLVPHVVDAWGGKRWQCVHLPKNLILSPWTSPVQEDYKDKSSHLELLKASAAPEQKGTKKKAAKKKPAKKSAKKKATKKRGVKPKK